MHAKVRSYAYERINDLLPFERSINSQKDTLFYTNLVASLVATLFNVARQHHQVSYEELKS